MQSLSLDNYAALCQLDCELPGVKSYANVTFADFTLK